MVLTDLPWFEKSCGFPFCCLADVQMGQIATQLSMSFFRDGHQNCLLTKCKVIMKPKCPLGLEQWCHVLAFSRQEMQATKLIVLQLCSMLVFGRCLVDMVIGGLGRTSQLAVVLPCLNAAPAWLVNTGLTCGSSPKPSVFGSMVHIVQPPPRLVCH